MHLIYKAAVNLVDQYMSLVSSEQSNAISLNLVKIIVYCNAKGVYVAHRSTNTSSGTCFSFDDRAFG